MWSVLSVTQMFKKHLYLSNKSSCTAAASGVTKFTTTIKSIASNYVVVLKCDSYV
jgi:hypothetical protein